MIGFDESNLAFLLYLGTFLDLTFVFIYNNAYKPSKDSSQGSICIIPSLHVNHIISSQLYISSISFSHANISTNQKKRKLTIRKRGKRIETLQIYG